MNMRIVVVVLISGMSGVLFADTIPGGDVSGTWYAANSPYYINGNITVPAGDTIVIEPGVSVVFLANYRLTANGLLTAAGTPADSIRFFPQDTVEGWLGINLYGDNQPHTLSYCSILHAHDLAIYINCSGNTAPVISHSSLGSNQRCLVSEPLGYYPLQVTDCVFHDNSTPTDGGAIYSSTIFNRVEIAGCLFANNMAANEGGAICFQMGMGDGNNISIRDCSFIGNRAYERGGAVSCWEFYDSTLLFENCVFGLNYVDDGSPNGGGAIAISMVDNCDLVRCCFYGNRVIYAYDRGCAIHQYPDYGHGSLMMDHCTIQGIMGTAEEIVIEGDASDRLDVSNSIFTNSFLAIHQWDPATPTTVMYSDFHGNVDNIAAEPPNFGVLDRVNYNGDSCDCYYNIFMDPMYTDTANNDFHLTAGSPCIDAGDPAFAYDPDGTITDQGAYWFDQGTGVSERQVVKRAVKRDFLCATIFSGPLVLPKGKTCRIFDITGREVVPDQMKPGVYFVQISSEVVGKIIKIR